MNYIWVLLVFAVLFNIYAFAVQKLGFARLTYRRYFNVRSCYEGESVELVEEIINNKWLPIAWVRVESELPLELDFTNSIDTHISARTQHRSFFHLGMYRSIIRRHTLTATKRGMYLLGNVHVTLGDVIGFGGSTRPFDVNAVLLVYPQLLEGSTDMPTIRWQGDMVVKRFIVEDRFLVNGIREYMTGDNLREVHWKASARRGDLCVKTHDFTAFSRLVVYLNLQTREEQWDQMSAADVEGVENAVRYIAYLTQYALSQGAEVGFCCNGCLLPDKDNVVRIPPAAGSTQYSVLSEAYARLHLLRVRSIVHMLEGEITAHTTGMDIMLFSRYTTEYMGSLIERLRVMGNNVKVVDSF